MQTRIVEVLQKKMTNKNIGFFSNLAIYKMAQVATNMKATVTYIGGKEIPVNVYALSLATSGFSKGKSLKFLETEVFTGFRENFINHSFGTRSVAIVDALGDEQAIITGKDPDHETQNIWKTITNLPKYIYTFGSGSTPEGLKGLMTALAMRDTGAVTLEIDEIGSSITANKEVLDNMLMSYDGGLIKNKLKKTESNDDIINPVPTNLMAFGTPSKLFDGGTSEDMLMDFLDTGYGRRFIYAYAEDEPEIMSAQDKMLQLMDASVDTEASLLNDEIKMLSSTANFKRNATLTDDANVALFEYEESCLNKASAMKSYQEIEKTEMSHRYFKVLKIAGTYAFMELADEVSVEMIQDAIELVEMSGEAFGKMMTREKSFVRLARYIAEQGSTPVTLAELTHDLSGFFKGSESAKREMLTLAKSWAASNNIVIKENVVSDVSYFTGEIIENTSLDSLIVSASKELAAGYAAHYARWDKFDKVCKSDINICTHHFEKNHREAINAKLPMNLLVLDVDEGVSLKMAQKLLEDQEYLMYTTKRHTESHNRFRIIMPMSKIIKLDEAEHKEFYKNVAEWLPFEVDDQTFDIARKWQCYKAATIYRNKGALFDPTLHIPGTTKAARTKEQITHYGTDTSRLERHIFMTTEGRNNALLKIAMIHVDRGLDADTVYSLVNSANAKLNEPIDERELSGTIMKTVYKRISEREDT